MEIPTGVYNGEPGIYEFGYKGSTDKESKYRVVVGNIVPGEPVSVTVHGGGSGGYVDTTYEQRSLLDGQSIEEAMASDNVNITGQNQIDVFPLGPDGFFYPGGPERALGIVDEATTGVEENFGSSTVYMAEAHSSTARSAIFSAINYSKNNGGTKPAIAMLLEPSLRPVDFVKFSDEDIQTMRDNNIITLLVRGNDMTDDIGNAIKKGMPLIDIDLDFYYDYYGNDVLDKNFEHNHSFARMVMGGLDYADIANGTFSWVDAFGEDGKGLPHFDPGWDGYKFDYRTEVTVKMYNIDGFEKGQEVSMAELDAYLATTVMSDEEYFEYELNKMNAIVKDISNYIGTISSDTSYSNTRLPKEASDILNKLIKTNEAAFNNATFMLGKISAAKESYTALDEYLNNDAIKMLGDFNVTTPEFIPEETDLSLDNKEKTNEKIYLDSSDDNNSSKKGDSKKDNNESEDSEDKSDKFDDSENEDTVRGNVTSDDNGKDDDNSSSLEFGDDKSKIESIGAGSSAAVTGAATTNEKFVSDDSVVEPLESNKKLVEIKPKDDNKKNKTPIIDNSSNKNKSNNKNNNKNNTTVKEEVAPAVVQEETPVDEPIDVPVTEVVEDPVINSEEVFVEPVVTPKAEKVTPSIDSKILKTVGIASGIGAGIGAVAYGINEQKNKKEIEDGYGYSYSESNEKSDYEENETESDDYSPYAHAVANEEELVGGDYND